MTLSVKTGPPTGTVTVSGTGFGAFEAVDVYFDTTDETLVSANGTGKFSGATITVPASAMPGNHYITAVGRHSGFSAQATFAVNTNWSQLGYSVTRRGANPYENVLSAGNVAGIDEDWRFTTGGEMSSSPAVANGMVYVGSGDAAIYALSAATGQVMWGYATNGPIESSPVVANGLVLVGSTDGNLYAFDPDNGAQRWVFNATSPIESTAAVANGVVYVGTEDGTLFALNALSGGELWDYLTAFPVLSSPAAANGVVYAAFSSGTVLTFNAATGAQLGDFDVNGTAFTSPAVVNGVVYVGSDDGYLYALGLAGGTAPVRRPVASHLHPNYALRSATTPL